MKLLFCKKCLSLFSLALECKTCDCGDTKGFYHTDGLNAIYSGDSAVPIGFANNTFVHALQNQPKTGMGKDFTAFVIPKKCDTFEKLR